MIAEEVSAVREPVPVPAFSVIPRGIVELLASVASSPVALSSSSCPQAVSAMVFLGAIPPFPKFPGNVPQLFSLPDERLELSHQEFAPWYRVSTLLG